MHNSVDEEREPFQRALVLSSSSSSSTSIALATSTSSSSSSSSPVTMPNITPNVVLQCADEESLPNPIRKFAALLREKCASRMRYRRRGCGTMDANRYWLNVDPCGIICASLVYFIVVFCDYNVVTRVIRPWFGNSFMGWLHTILFNLLATLALLCHARAMLSNPGAVPFNAKPTSPEGWARQCNRCANFKPDRAHHCSVCGRCIIKMDHHCPWVNNCVGLANHKYFLLFLLYIFSICMYALVLLAIRFYICLSSVCTEKSSAGDGLMLLITTILAILFMLFTCCLGIDQSSVVTSNETQIDRMKNRRGHGGTPTTSTTTTGIPDSRRRIWDNLSEVVGGDTYREGFQITWLLPTPIVYTDPEALTGYCFRDTPRPKTIEEMEQV